MNTRKPMSLLDRGRVSKATRGQLVGFQYEIAPLPFIWRLF